MSELDETQAIDQVIGRLSSRFPGLQRDHIADVVEDEHRHLEKGRVRDFVPVLVEKAAKSRLKKEAKASDTVVEQGEALAPQPDSAPGPDPMEVERAKRQVHLSGDPFGNSGEDDR